MTERQKNIPFSIPESLASYLVQFEDAPQKTIGRLKNHLKKRGPDPVGYFVLGWLYFRSGKDEKAMQCALKAKNYAPGSPFIAKVHYFFSHPQLFEAWQHAEDHAAIPRQNRSLSGAPITDLDQLIEKLSSLESKRIKNNDEQPSDNGSELSEDSDALEGIVSETLAKIHEQQGKLEAAIKTYKQLLKHRPDKKESYQKEIKRLQSLKEEQSNTDNE